MDEFDDPAAVISMDRLDLDIGTIPPTRLGLAAERVEAALRDALTRLLGNVESGHARSPNAAKHAAAGAALIDMLAQYLRNGLWPYRMFGDKRSDPVTVLIDMIDSAPEQLAQLLHAHRGRPEVVARLARQLPSSALERLLQVLAPGSAASIIAAMKNSGAAQRALPLVPLIDGSSDRRAWQLALRGVLTATTGDSQPTQYHQLIEPVLEPDTVDSTDALLPVGPSTTSHSNEWAPISAASPHAQGVPDGKDESIAGVAAPASAPIELLEQFLLRGSWYRTDPDALLLLLADSDPDALASLFRRHAWNDAMLRRLTELISTEALGRLLAVLEPAAAAAIVAYMLETRALHRLEPIVPLSDRTLERLLWHIALRYVLREAGTQFNRRSFVASLIEDIANEERVGYGEALDALRLGVVEAAKRRPVVTSLVAIINELAAEREPTEGAGLFELERLLERGTRISAADLRKLTEQARRRDPRGLRLLLRRHARRDAAKFVRTIGAGFSTPALIALFLDAEPAREVVILALRLSATRATGTIAAHQFATAIVRAIALPDGLFNGRQELLARVLQEVANVSGVASGQLAASIATQSRGEGAGTFADSRAGDADTDEAAGSARASLRRSAAVAEAEEAERLYARLDQLRHFLRTGVLPWRDILAEPELAPKRLLKLLQQMPQGGVRAALAGMRLAHSALVGALACLSAVEALRFIALLLPRSAETSELAAAVAQQARRADHQPVYFARVVAALIEDRLLDLEAFAATLVEQSDQPPAPDSVDAVLSTLAAEIGRQEGTPASWNELLLVLLARDARAGRRFLAAIAARSAGGPRLGELCAPPFLKRILIALVPVAAPVLAQLAESLVVYGAEAGVSRQSITEATLAEALSIEPDTAAGFSLIMRLLRRLFGEALPPWLAAMLRRDVLWRLPSGAAAAIERALTRDAAFAHVPEPDVREPDLARPGPIGALVPAVSGDAPASQQPTDGEWLFRALADRDLSAAQPGTELPELLSELLNQLVRTPQEDLGGRLVVFLHQARNRAHLIRLLPERLLARLIMLAVPRVGRDLLLAGELLAGAAGHTLDRRSFWEALLDTAAAPDSGRSVDRLAIRLFEAAGRVAKASGTQHEASAVALVNVALQRARDAGHAALVAALSRQRDELIDAFAGLRRARAPRSKEPDVVTKPAKTALRGRTAFRLGGEGESPDGEPIYIGNAGLVLANPFLPQFFDVLGFMERGEDGKPRVRDEEAASRAVHLLQYLVDGYADRPEPLLVLNKLLCGLPVSAPVERSIELTDLERDTCEKLLQSMIENWPIVRGSSIAALRETFLQREGKLMHADSGWRLQVQRKTLDVLVDQLPWSIGVVFHAWMPGAVHVTW